LPLQNWLYANDLAPANQILKVKKRCKDEYFTGKN
jgi:hypothetical protein